MIDTARTYTEKEADALSEQGYEFVSVQTVTDRAPVYVVSGYASPLAFCEPEFGIATRVYRHGELIDSFY